MLLVLLGWQKGCCYTLISFKETKKAKVWARFKLKFSNSLILKIFRQKHSSLHTVSCLQLFGIGDVLIVIRRLLREQQNFFCEQTSQAILKSPVPCPEVTR